MDGGYPSGLDTVVPGKLSYGMYQLVWEPVDGDIPDEELVVLCKCGNVNATADSDEQCVTSFFHDCQRACVENDHRKAEDRIGESESKTTSEDSEEYVDSDDAKFITAEKASWLADAEGSCSIGGTILLSPSAVPFRSARWSLRGDTGGTELDFVHAGGTELDFVHVRDNDDRDEKMQKCCGKQVMRARVVRLRNQWSGWYCNVPWDPYRRQSIKWLFAHGPRKHFRSEQLATVYDRASLQQAYWKWTPTKVDVWDDPKFGPLLGDCVPFRCFPELPRLPPSSQPGELHQCAHCDVVFTTCSECRDLFDRCCKTRAHSVDCELREGHRPDARGPVGVVDSDEKETAVTVARCDSNVHSPPNLYAQFEAHSKHQQHLFYRSVDRLWSMSLPLCLLFMMTIALVWLLILPAMEHGEEYFNQRTAPSPAHIASYDRDGSPHLLESLYYSTEEYWDFYTVSRTPLNKPSGANAWWGVDSGLWIPQILWYREADNDEFWTVIEGSLINASMVLICLVVLTALFFGLYVAGKMEAIRWVFIVAFGCGSAIFSAYLIIMTGTVYEVTVEIISICLVAINAFAISVVALKVWFAEDKKSTRFQLYIIFACLALAWPLCEVPSVTLWMTLLLLGVYDLMAVLCPGGPLKYFLEREGNLFNVDIPGLMYLSRYFGLGTGDFVFYTALVARAAYFNSVGAALSLGVAILSGLYVTIYFVQITGKTLPALPASLFLGCFVMLFFHLTVEPWVSDIFEASY